MAKGNMLLGYARGKVGDLVFTRVDGEQVSRPRNRHPFNPRSNKQLVQRAIMATVMAAYSAGRDIFDHSFQGYRVGAGCQRRFMALNANALRTQLSADWDTAAAEVSLAKVTAPKIQTPVPNQYVISEGSLSQSLFSFDSEGGYYSWNLPAPLAGEKVKAYAERVGLVTGDIYTFVFFDTSKAADDVLFKALGIASVDFDIVYRGSFGWVRLITKNLTTVEDVITNDTLLTTLFEIEQGGVAALSSTTKISVTFAMDTLDAARPGAEDNGYSIGLIKSRRDADLRSNSKMYVGNPDEFGLYWNDILTAWISGTTEIGSSDLILEGGDE